MQRGCEGCYRLKCDKKNITSYCQFDFYRWHSVTFLLGSSQKKTRLSSMKLISIPFFQMNFSGVSWLLDNEIFVVWEFACWLRNSSQVFAFSLACCRCESFRAQVQMITTFSQFSSFRYNPRVIEGVKYDSWRLRKNSWFDGLPTCWNARLNSRSPKNHCESVFELLLSPFSRFFGQAHRVGNCRPVGWTGATSSLCNDFCERLRLNCGCWWENRGLLLHFRCSVVH